MHKRAARYARFYRSVGFNPLPSRSDIKAPALRSGDIARYRDGGPIPDSWAEDEHWWASNIQLCCGVPWRLLVVDLDGLRARVIWRRWARERGTPRTWTVLTGGGGVHLYYTLPSWLPACKSRRIWGIWDPDASPKPAWVKHNFVEVLADRALCIAPPSRHVVTGEPYRFAVGPAEMPRPAPVPLWVLGMPEIRPPRPPPRTRRARRVRGGRHFNGKTHDWREVLGRLSPGRKVELAVGWGLRLAADGENAAGWVSCHAIDRDDRHPSASFHPDSGVFWTSAGCLGFFELAVALEAHDTWMDACNALGEETR